MKQVLHHPTARRNCLMGLIGIALSVSVLFGEGQARTLATPPPMPSANLQSPLSSGAATKTSPGEKHRESARTNYDRHPEVVAQEIDNDDKSSKKRLGLAIIFLGVLAEKS